METDDEDFEKWLAAPSENLTAVVRESVDTPAVLRAIKRKAAEQVQRELTEKVAVAVTTGQVPASGGQEVDYRWTVANNAYRRIRVMRSGCAEVGDTPVAETPGGKPGLVRPEPIEDVPAPFMVGIADDLAACPSLLSHLRDGSLRRVMSAVGPLTVRYCQAEAQVFGIPPEDMDCVTSRIFTVLLKELPKAAPAGDKTLLSFSYTLLRREMDQVVAHVRYTEDSDTADVPGEQWPMARLLAGLSNAHRQVIILRVMVGLTADETAEAMEKTADWVRTAQHDALRALRRAIGSTDQ